MFAAVTRCLLWLLLPGVKLPCCTRHRQPQHPFFRCVSALGRILASCVPSSSLGTSAAGAAPPQICLWGPDRELNARREPCAASLVCVDQCLGSLVLGHSIFWGAARHFGGARQCWPVRGCQALNKRASQLLAAAPALF